MAITRIKNNQITDSTINAAAKLSDYSITAGKLANSITYGSDWTITGNLTVNGTTTTVDTTNMTVEDPLLLLASDQTGTPAHDIGFIGERGDENNVALVWDESEGEFVAAFVSDAESSTNVTISAYSDFKAHNIDANAAIAAATTITATGNVAGGNITTGGAVEADGLISSGTTITATGNITGGNLNTGAQVVATGNITGGNLITSAAVESATITTSGEATLASAIVSDLTDGRVVIAGSAGALEDSTNLTFNGSTLGVTGAITASTTITATGNVTGGNLTTAGDVTTATVTASGAIAGSTTITATGNITGGNLNTGAQVVATGNITGGNLITTGELDAATISLSGDAVVAGNLTVGGDLAYVNVTTLAVEDPIIGAGRGPNNASLSSDDNKDRGLQLWYYDSEEKSAFIGWDDSAGKLVLATDADLESEVANVQTLGTVVIGTAETTAVTASTTVTATGNVTGGNLVTAGDVTTATVTASGAIAGSTTIAATGNITGGNLITSAAVESATVTASQTVTATGNVTGGNLTTAGDVTTATVTASGAIAGSTTITATGNVAGGNLTTAGQVAADNVAVTNGITGATIDIAGQSDFDNVRIDGNDVTAHTGGIVTFNDAGGDVDFRFEGDTDTNLLVLDAGADEVLIGTATPTTGAKLKIGSTDSMLLPVGNTAQRPGTGVTGMLRFNTSIDQLEFYDSDSWTTAGSEFTVIASQIFNGDGSTVAFTLNEAQTTASCIVSINGVVQLPTTAYGVSSTTLTFTEAPLSGDVIEVRKLTTTSTISALQNTAGTAVVETQEGVANTAVTGNLIVSGSIEGASFIGLDATKINNGTSEMAVIATNGNIRANISGSTVALISSDTVAVTGAVTASTTITATGNITGGNLTVSTGSVTLGSIVNANSDGVGNIGASGDSFNTVFAKATSAQYADVAENYAGDADYEPGTVVVFGGDAEVTASTSENDHRVAGVVTTEPAFIMNSGIEAEHVVGVALTGRVPTKVTGSVAKGDLMVSGANGRAVVNNTASAGRIIGKALENNEGGDAVIEVVVGRF